jgi:phosphatidylglycerol---prolipoprotein diacylglyceryl transferase
MRVLPVLFKIGSFELYTYGLMIIIGFFASLALLLLNGRREKVRGDHLVDLGFVSLIAGLVGARLLFIITQWPIFVLNFMLAEQTIWSLLSLLAETLYIWRGGFVFYGGLILGIVAFVWRARTYKISAFQALDFAAPALSLGHAIGRTGCFLAGCCYGKSCPEDYPFAVVFSDPLSLAPRGIRLYPAQLFDSLNALLIFALLQFMVSRRKFDGQITSLYLILYGIGRFIVEIYRGDDQARGVYFNGAVSTSQIISAISIVAGLAIYLIRRQAPRFQLEAHRTNGVR